MTIPHTVTLAGFLCPHAPMMADLTLSFLQGKHHFF